MSTLTKVEAEKRYEEARAAAYALRVPNEDRTGGSVEPVTMGGTYEVSTVSGRRAWARYAWVGGQLTERWCTYDMTAEDALTEAAVGLADFA